MAKTEARASAGTGAPAGLTPAQEMKAAIADFVSDLKTFKTDIEANLEQQKEHLTMLERKTVRGARPTLSTAAGELDAPHKKAIGAYLRSGDEMGLRSLEIEAKALNTAVASEGGYLVDPQTAEMIQSVLRSTASIRAIANVVTVDATSYDVIIDTTEAGAGWATESTSITETATPIVERISIALHELSALPKASQRLLEDSAFDVEGWLAGRIAEKFARAEAAAFVAGDGIDKPKGFLAHDAVAEGSQIWGELGYITTGVSGDIGDGEPLVELVYALGARYRANGTFVMNSKTAGTVRKLKDLEGRFLWSDGLAAAEPARLLGYPVLIAEDMPDISANSVSVAFGDFRAGYTIAERPDLRILRDPYSAKPHVLFYATKRVGGDVVDFEAIKLLKFGLS
jgi:HK97 family phage major capsid protein